MATPAILGSLQCMQLAKNLADLQRNDEAAMVANRILGAHPGHAEAARLRARLAGSPSAAAAAPTPTGIKAAGRNDPCPCGSGKRYKACHGALA
ncbi:MAG: SEC-C domain-containing protein [Betaproteobacteria bacterium]|nr:SEC-C domain-containing protein [Betaproteobacteria bacterium]